MKWFCLRSQPKHAQIAAGHLHKDAGMEVFLPRVRFRRATKRGRVWAT
jgi:transcriptional antiterminator RfaH